MVGSKELYDIFEIIYPIGIIIELDNDSNPKDLFGIGEWEQIKDCFLLACGDSYEAGNSGGEANITLTTVNMPAHTHTRGTMDIVGEFRAYNEYNLNNTSLASKLTGPFWYNTDESDNYGTSTNLTSGTSDAVRQIHFEASRAWTGETSSVGEGESFTNMPPYYVCYRWKRIG